MFPPSVTQHCNLHTPPLCCCKFSIQLVAEYKYHSCYTVCSQGTCIKPNSSMISCQQANRPKIMAYVSGRRQKLVSARWQKHLKPPINNNGLNRFQLLSKTNNTNKNTWFLNIVQHLVIQKEHNILELDLFPSSADMMGRHILSRVQ
jgi:hypothetical protein